MTSRWGFGQRTRDESGQLAGAEMLPLAMLVFAGGVLFFAQVWAIVDAKSATEAAAREAARTFVESTGSDHEALASATSAASGAIEASGRSSARASIVATGPLSLERCARASFEVVYRVPLLAVPLVGGFGDGIEVRSTHSEIVDPFRDGLDGRSSCVG